MNERKTKLKSFDSQALKRRIKLNFKFKKKSRYFKMFVQFHYSKKVNIGLTSDTLDTPTIHFWHYYLISADKDQVALLPISHRALIQLGVENHRAYYNIA